MQRLIKFMGVVLAGGVLAFASYQDYQDSLIQQAHYCSMVNAGHWPAYKSNVQCDTERGQ